MTEVVPLGGWTREIADRVWSHRTPLEGTLEVTRVCPFRCAHCYCPPASPGEELVIGEMIELLDQLAEAGCLWLTLTGGEPLARPDFLEIYRAAATRGFLVTVFTNAYLLDEPVLRAFAALPPESIEVSVYGASDAGYRAACGAADGWGRVRRNVAALSETGLRFVLKTVATRDTVGELGAMQRWAAELGVRFRFDPAVNPRVDGGLGPLAVRLSPEEVVRLEAESEERVAAWAEACSLSVTPGGADPGLGCGAGRTSFHVTAHGVLTPCMVVPETVGASVRGRRFREAWEAELPDRLGRIPPEHPDCRPCELASACDGCKAWAFLEEGSWSARPEFACALARLRTRAFGGVGHGEAKAL